MLPTEDLFVYVYVLIDDLITAGVIAIPPRPGPVPTCSDAELLAVALVRHLLGHRGEPGSWPRSPATGRTCSRSCRTKARRTGGSAGCGARSNYCAARWPHACRRMTASRSIPAPCP